MDDNPTPSDATTTEAPVVDSPEVEVTTTPEAEPTQQATPQPEETPASESKANPDVDDIVAWSEKRGTPIDPTNENEVRLAKSLRDTQKEFHTSRQADIGEVLDRISPDSEAANMMAEMKVERHFRKNPEHEQYRDKMTEIANTVAETDQDLAVRLAHNPTLLYKMALAEGLDDATSAAAAKAAKETREQLARESQTTTARPAATNQASEQARVFTQAEFNALPAAEYRALNGNFKIEG